MSVLSKAFFDRIRLSVPEGMFNKPLSEMTDEELSILNAEIVQDEQLSLRKKEAAEARKPQESIGEVKEP